MFTFEPLPLKEVIICFYVTWLAKQCLKYSSIRGYLLALRHLQIMEGHHDPCMDSQFPRLRYVLNGIRRSTGNQPVHIRLPITPEILFKLKQVWSNCSADPDIIMMWAACCLGFFAFLRCGEFTSTKEGHSPPLQVDGVRVDDHHKPTCISLFLSKSKTDPYGKGITLFVGTTGSLLCPVAAVLAYLAIRPSTPGPLFLLSSGVPLTRETFVSRLKQGLSSAGIDSSGYNGHSFRIGAATTAARVGIPDSTIKILGRWESSAYCLYIRTPRQQLTGISSNLVSVL